ETCNCTFGFAHPAAPANNAATKTSEAIRENLCAISKLLSHEVPIRGQQQPARSFIKPAFLVLMSYRTHLPQVGNRPPPRVSCRWPVPSICVCHISHRPVRLD